jgi:hypothetical protein
MMKWVLVLVAAASVLSGQAAAGDAPNYGAIAMNAANWIVQTRIDTPQGCYWADDLIGQSSVSYNRTFDLYSGISGTIKYLIEAHMFSGKADYLETAQCAGNYILAHLPALIESKVDTSLYHGGVAGIGYGLYELGKYTKTESYTHGVQEIIDYLFSEGKPSGGGIKVNKMAPLRWGETGTLLFVLHVYQDTKNATLLQFASEMGDYLVSLGVPAHGGLKWYSDFGPNLEAPNYAEGTSGISYTLLGLHKFTQKASHLDAALKGAAYLQAVADTSNGGCVIFHSSSDPSLIYLGECNGNAGTGRLWVRLFQVTGNSTWLTWSGMSAKTIRDHQPAPPFSWYYYIGKSDSPIWSNVGQCDGSAAVVELSMLMHEVNGTLFPDNWSYGQMVAQNMIDVGTTKGDETYWVTTEWRTRMSSTTAPQVGYMQGASGVGSLMLGLEALSQGKPSNTYRINLPDSPRNFGFSV